MSLRLPGEPDPNQDWQAKADLAASIASDPNAASDSDKLRSVADHFDMHDDVARRNGTPITSTAMQDFLRGLADRLAADKTEWGIRVSSTDGTVEVRYDDEMAARRGVERSRTWFTDTDTDMCLIRRRIGTWTEVT